MRRCSIFVTLLKNEYIEVEFNKARCFCSFRCLSNPHSCTITSLIFRTQGIRALLSVRKFLRVQVSVRIVPCATFLVRSLPCAYFRAQISSCASFRIPLDTRQSCAYLRCIILGKRLFVLLSSRLTFI